MPLTPLAIIGAGPAGLAAAMQTIRLGLTPLVFERRRVGGAIRTAFLVENYPGFPRSVAGERLANLMATQARGLGVEIDSREIRAITPAEGAFLLGPGGDCGRTRAVIVATGSAPRTLDVTGEEELAGDSLFYRGDELMASGPTERVVVIGGGEAAFDQAAMFATAGMEVTIAIRGKGSRALASQMSRIEDLECSILWQHRVEGLADGPRVTFASPTGLHSLAADKILVSIGKDPAASMLPGGIRGGPGPVVAGPSGETTIPGLFLAGDLRRGTDRQTAIAVGDGMAAALAAHRFLREESR